MYVKIWHIEVIDVKNTLCYYGRGNDHNRNGGVKMSKKILVSLNVIAGVGFIIAGVGNLLHGTKWIGAAFLVCSLLQFVSAYLNWRREI